jgi:chromosomal replication initiator protein
MAWGLASGRKPVEAQQLDPTLWKQILAVVRQNYPTHNRVWFDELHARQLSNGMIQVLVASLAQLNYCTSRCAQAFTSAAQSVTGRLVSVAFHCENLPRGGVFGDNDSPLPISPDYTFEQFVTGPCNRLPHAASVAVAEQPGKAYNPLFIHGDVGLGKTHLLQAACQRVMNADPDARIMYLSCENFMTQFINAIEAGHMNDFRNRYRHVDMLVIDDIHFLAGRDRTQEEFFHTFNTLHQQNKQIILSADCSPSEIPELEDRLVSRFNWGLVAKIDKPCYETRIAIVKKKARIRGLEIPEDVICYVSARIETNTRELEGAVTKLQGMSLLNNGVIDLDLAKQALGDVEAVLEKRITVQQIIDAVVKYYGLKVADLQSKKRNASIAFPRQVCMYLARKHTRYSLEEIGGYFGGRDHTTVLHGVRTIETRMGNDREVHQQVLHLDQSLVG